MGTFKIKIKGTTPTATDGRFRFTVSNGENKKRVEAYAEAIEKQIANQKAYDELLNFDVNAGQDEINNLEAMLKKANELSFSPTAPTKAPTTVTRNGISYSVDSKGNYSITPNNAGNTRVEAGYALRDSAEKAKTAQYEYLKENGFSSINDLKSQINQKKQYLNDAKSTQSTHAALSKYNKTQEENADEINSLYTDMGTKKSSYEENGKGALDWISKGIAAFMYGDSPKNIAVSNEESEYMSASEKYYTAKYGTKAEQQELLNIFKQSGDSKYSQEIKELTHSLYGDSAFDEYIVGNIEAGARNFFYETAATFNAITSIFGLPIDETKAYQDLKKAAKAQNVYASNAAIALGDTDNIGGNLIQVAMAFIPDLIIAVATKGASGGGATTKSLIKIARAGIKAQKTASMTNKFLKYGSGMLDAVSKGISATAKNPMFWTSFSHTFGTDYETALEGGADTTTAYLYATITSITNALVEVGSGVESRLPDVISGKSKFQILDFIKECLEEGNEEVIQGVITNLNQLLYDSDKEFFSLENEDAIINPSRMLKEHAMGTLGGAVLGGGTKIGQRIISGSTRGITLAGKSAIRNNIVSDLAEFGRTAADENVRAVSEGFLTTGKITNYDAGVLFTHAQKQINYDLNLAKTPAKTRAAIQKYIKGNYPEAIKQMVIGNEIAKMYDISDIASKVSQREYSFSTEKTAPTVNDIQNDTLYPTNSREASAFNRSLANQTSNLKNTKKSNIMIYTADYAYFVTVNGYMSGKIVAKELIDGNEEIINKMRKEFENGTLIPSEGTNSLIKSIRNDRGRGYRRHASLKETLAAEGNEDLDRAPHIGNSRRGNSRSDKSSGESKLKTERSVSVYSTSRFTEPDLTAQTPQTFEERAMANIIGGDAQLTDGQRQVESIAKMLGVKIEWYENADVTDRGYYENGVIGINVNANQAYTVVFTHEFLHHLQNNKFYADFVSFVESTEAYKKWIAAQGGYDAFGGQIKSTYLKRTGKVMGDTRLQYEIMARFISEEMFTEADFNEGGKGYNFLSEVAKNNRWYHRILDWVREMINRLRRRSVQADFIKMERLLKRAYNDVQSTAQVDTGKEYDINQNFYSEFDSWDGKDTNKVFTIGTTSEALKSVNIKNQEIKMRSGMILQKLSKHPEMSRQIFRDIPELLENPIIIQFSDAIDPNTGKPKYDSRITVMGELYADMVIDGKTVKKPVLVSLELLPTNQKKTQILNISFVTSAYTKDTLQQYINENSILYIDPNKKRTQNWLSLNRLSLPLGENQRGPIRKITYIGEKVKIENSTKKTDIQLALEKAGVIDSYGNSIFKNSHNDTSKSKENFENREYSFDETKETPVDANRTPAKMFAQDLLNDTGSSYEQDMLIKDIEKIYAAADKGDARSVTSLSQDTAAKILNDIEGRDFSKEGENAGENALKSLTNDIINHINEETHGTLNRVRAENKRLKHTVNDFEAAQQRQTDNANSIKEQLRANSNLLNSMDVIEHFDSNENFKSNAETLEWVQQQFSKIDYKVYRDDFGEIILDKKRIKNGLSYLKTNEERLAFALVPKVLQEGIEISQHFEHKGRAYDTVTFAAPINLSGQRGNMAVVVRKEGKNYYKVHRLLLPNGNSFVINEKRDIAETAGGVNKNSSLSPTDNVSTNSITNSYENVNTTDSNRNFDLKQIRAEERAKFEAAAQRRTDLDVIKRAVNRIDTKLRQNSNAKHVPKELRKAAIEFCSIFAQNDTNVFDSTKIWNVRKLYDALLNSQKANGYGNADPDILEDIQYIGDVMQNRRLISLNKTERETVRRIAEHLEHLINTTNEIFIEEKKQEAAKVAEEEIERLSKKSSKAYINLGDGALRRSVDKVKEFLHVGNKPSVFFFEEVGGLLEKVYKDISNGFDKAIFNLQECSEQLQGIIQNHDYKKWLKDKKAKQKATRGGLVLKKQDGQQMTVTPEQVMSIYAINLREEANQDTKGTNHLKQGGIVLATREIIQQIKGDTKQNKKETAENTLDKMIKHGWFTAWADKPYRIDDNDIKQIKEYLGKDGMAFVEEMVHWLSTVGAQLGNEASMKLYNINKFGEEYYFPIETSSDYLARQVFEKKGNKTLAGSSFAKNVTEKANTPIVVGNFLDICADHMIAMCAYNALTVPIDNFKRIWGYSAVGENGEAAVSLRNEIKRIFGQEYVDYIDRFIKDVDGGIDGQQPGDSLAAELIGKFKKNAVVAKLSVAIQQPSSLLRAMAYIEPKYLFSKGAKLTTAEWNECMKYNSVAIQKEIGRFDVGNPKTARDYMLGTEYNGAKEKIDGFLHDENYRDDVLGKGPEFMDKFTWCIIWNGCKAKARDNLKAAATKVNTALSDVKKRITQNMSDSERYEILKGSRVTLVNVEKNQYNSDFDFAELENNIKSIVEKPLIKKLQSLGLLKKYTSVAIDDIDFDFTGKGVRKSLHSQEIKYGGSKADFTKAILNLQELLDNAVLIETHTDKGKGTEKEERGLERAYVLLSAMQEGSTIIPVQFEIKEYVDNNNRLYLAVALTKMETGVMGNTASDEQMATSLIPVSKTEAHVKDNTASDIQMATSLVSTSNISIREIFQKINPKDRNFLKYVPNEFLNSEQISAKEAALAEDKTKYGNAVIEKETSDTSQQVDFEEQVKMEAAKLFKEVIEHTQVYDSVLSRSQNMRSHSRWTQIVTSFMGESTVNLNLLLKAVSEFKNGNRKFAGKIVGSIVASTFLNALLKSLVTAMCDDEEDKSYGEKYVTAVGQNFWSDVWPHTWVPLISDAASIWEGYKIERADMSLVQDLYNGLNALDSDKKSTWDKILGIAAPLSSMTGVPVGNIARDIGSFVKTVSHALNDDLEHTHGFKYAFNEGMWGEKKFAEYYEIMRDKQKKGDTQGYTELKEYLMGRGKTEKEIESGVKAAYSKSKAVTKQTDDYFAKLAQNALFGNLPEEKQADVKTAVKRYLTESAMNAATGKEISKTNQKAAEAEKKGSSAVNYFLAKASFEDTDNSGGISNEEKIAAINKMNISALEKQALIMLYTKK